MKCLIVTMLADSCVIISEILGIFNCVSRGPTDTSYALFLIIQMALFCNFSGVLQVVTPHEPQTEEQYLKEARLARNIAFSKS